MMKRRWLVLLGWIGVSLAYASASMGINLQPITIDLQDKAKLQRGAKMFMNYCSGCHALRYMRYNRMAQDLGLTTFDGEVDSDLLYSNLIFTKAKIQDPIQISMLPTDALKWFGIVPPDLSLTVRERSASWVYTYLKTFYVDKSRPFGANNLLIADVSMPNILEPLAGRYIAVNAENQPDPKAISHLLLIEKGSMNQHEFDSAVQDLVTFLAYVAEPVKLVRYHIGVMVLVYLGIFLIIAYLLKKAYWQRLH